MSDLKFLSDGRKVSVVGKINKTEFIVQEIFVTENGDEIPSGENFTAKSLHDTPVQSYKEKEAINVEARLEKAKKEKDLLDKEIKVLSGKRQGYADILKQNAKFLQLFDEYDNDYLADVLMGNVKYCVSKNYGWYNVSTFEDNIFSWDSHYGDKSYKGLNMMKVFALTSSPYVSGRECRVDISRYPDGSGNDQSYKFFKDKSDLKDYLLAEYHKQFKEGKVTLSIIKQLQQWIHIDNADIEIVKQKEIDNLLKSQEDAVKRVTERYKTSLAKLNT